MPIPRLPQVCSQCGLTYATDAVSGDNVRGFQIGTLQTECPRCGGAGFAKNLKIDAHGGQFSLSVQGIPEVKFREYAQIIEDDLNALRQFQPKTFNEIVSIVAAAQSGALSEEAAYERIAERLPAKSAAAVKQLSGLEKAGLVITIVSGLVGIPAGIKGLLPSEPAAISSPAPATSSITINNNITLVNRGTPKNPGSVVKPPVIKREAARRLRQMERQRA